MPDCHSATITIHEWATHGENKRKKEWNRTKILNYNEYCSQYRLSDKIGFVSALFSMTISLWFLIKCSAAKSCYKAPTIVYFALLLNWNINIHRHEKGPYLL